MVDSKQIDVTCPCCSAVLAIDVRTSSVLRATPPGEVDELGKPKLDESRWDAATRRTASRTETSRVEFDGALEKERSREQDLDALFEKAKDKVRRRTQEGGSEES